MAGRHSPAAVASWCERAEYASMKTELATGVASVTDYAEAKEPWFEEADLRVVEASSAER